MMNDNVITTLRYARADNEALKDEKPYILNFTPPEGLPKSNFKIEYYPDIEVRNLRNASLNFQTSGLAIAELESCMPGEHFENEELIESTYLPEVHECIANTLKPKEIYIFDYMVRRRAPLFPYQPTAKDNAPQPALSVHIDYTTREIDVRLKKYFGDRAEAFKKRRFQIINVWKPLAGPLQDYPMAYCDARTLDPSTDLLVVDEVFPTVANEVYQVLYNPAHEWYYVKDQLETEVAIFVGFDSQRGQDLAVPHCAFDLAELSSGKPRESIEVRAFVFYDDE